MTYWQPKPSSSRFVLPAASLVCLGIALWLLAGIGGRPAYAYDPLMFLLGLLFALCLFTALWLAYMVRRARTIAYRLTGDRLLITHGSTRIAVPFSAVTGVVAPYENVAGGPVTVWTSRRLHLPGYFVGQGTSPQLGPVVFVATAPPAEQVFVQTPGLAVGISPADPSGLVAEIKRRAQSGADDLEGERGVVTAQAGRRGPLAWIGVLWTDRTSRALMVGGLALNAAFFAYASIAYSRLPSQIALHWNAQGQVDRVGDPAELLRLPAYALAVWLVNVLLGAWVYRRDRATPVLLLAGAAAAQAVFLAGFLSVVLRV